ncbi:amidohydrolase family protein [Paracoccaceae bacterium Fryx2]|nr:amidohydrolase family protein [Paracoccaceae bacterium Fryx2]
MLADLILINADIRTMDAARPRAQALAVAGGRILALGTTQAMLDRAAPGCSVIDAGGRLVLPGFQDAHVHLLDGGTDLIAAAALGAAETVADLQALLAAHAAGSADPLVTGTGWRPGLFGDHNLTRAVLDAAVPDRPCIVYDSSFHNACLNSAAIALTGLGRDTPDPPNGHFVRDAAGETTGMLHEDAISWARPHLPEVPEATWVAGLIAGQAHANRHGITGILDPQIKDQHFAAYSGLDRAGGLTLRVAGAAAVCPTDTAASVVARLCALRAAAGGDFCITSAKVFLDGVLENRTAAMIAPYADAAGGNAPLMYPPEKIAELFTALDAARFQIHVHVIGDRAARAALDGLEIARAANGAWPALHQLAHLQVVHAGDFARIAALGAMANTLRPPAAMRGITSRRGPSLPGCAGRRVRRRRGSWGRRS